MTSTISATHQKVFDYLLTVNEHFHLNVVLRVAGGWVRDMLLGMQSNDIDIALETHLEKASSQIAANDEKRITVSGEVFARAVAQYQTISGEKGRTVSVIRTNPALSKHIETATICVCDVPVEFCALRADVYSSTHSRVPSLVRSASPKEDAERRDFTVNALFYNLHTKQVEDYTSGLIDLDRRVLRCPLPPLETFRDDPLRLLRGIRFVGQLGKLSFTLHPSIRECMSEEIYSAMEKKVSRERIGKEVVKMFTSVCPLKAIEQLNELELLDKIMLVEFYVKDKVGKRTITPEVERCVRMTDYYNSIDTKKLKVAQTLELCKIIVPLISRSEIYNNLREENVTNKPFVQVHRDEEQIALTIFIITLPFFRRGEETSYSQDSTESKNVNLTKVEGLFKTEDDEKVSGMPRKKEVQWEERLYALCIYGLKLSVNVYHVVKNMVSSYHILQESTQQLTLLSSSDYSVISNDNKVHLADALAPLHNAHSFTSCYKVTLLTYYIVELKRLFDVSYQASQVHDIINIFTSIWSTLERTPYLLDLYTFTLPINGNDLRNKYNIPPKEVGLVLIKMRYLLLLNPSYTFKEVENWLLTQKNV